MPNMLTLLKKNTRFSPSALSDRCPNLLAILGRQKLVLGHASVFTVLSIIYPVQVQSLMMTLKAHVLLLLASSEPFYVRTIISPYGMEYAIWICYGRPDTFIVSPHFLFSLYGPCTPRSIMGEN